MQRRDPLAQAVEGLAIVPEPAFATHHTAAAASLRNGREYQTTSIRYRDACAWVGMTSQGCPFRRASALNAHAALVTALSSVAERTLQVAVLESTAD